MPCEFGIGNVEVKNSSMRARLEPCMQLCTAVGPGKLFILVYIR